MRATVVVCLALVASVSAEAEPEPYTIGQVLAGAVAPGSVVKSISYGHGLPTVPASLTSVPAVTYTAGLHVPYAYGAYGGHLIGKREAEAEADPEPYTIGQVLAGAVAPGSVVKSITYGHGLPTVPASLTSVPAVTYTAGLHVPYTYGAYGGHFIGKREAEAEPEPYTVGQVLAGAVAPGSVVKSITYGGGLKLPASLTSVPAVTYAAGLHVPYTYGAYGGHFIGKREAEAEPEPYTVGQVLAGAVAPGSVVTSIDYGHGLPTVPASLTSVPAVTYTAGLHAPYVYGHLPYIG